MKATVITPWKSLEDLLYLRLCFFSTEDRISEGLSKVKAYQIRGSVPHPVECTAFILSVISSDNDSIDSYVLRLSYSMALVRMVNGYVDNYQGNANYPVYHIAKTIGIPSHFVELRHTATHDSLPSLELLRDVSRQALKWLWNNYWSTLEQTSPHSKSSIPNQKQRGGQIKEKNNQTKKAASAEKVQSEIKKLFVSWRRLRRNDPESAVDQWSPELSSIITDLKTYISSNEEDFYEVLFEKNILIPKSDPIDKRAVLYGPLLNQLAGDFFIERLVIRLSKVISSVGNEIDLDSFLQEHVITPDSKEQMNHKVASLFYWIEYIFFAKSQSLSNKWFSSLEIVIKYFLSFPQPWNIKILHRYFHDEETEYSNTDKKMSSLVNDLIDVFESSESFDNNSIKSIKFMEKQLQTFRENLSKELQEKNDHFENEANDMVNNEALDNCGWILQYN